MTDIFDIKTFIFWFLYSFDYFFIFWVVVFLVIFYLILYYFFDRKPVVNINTEAIENEKIRKRLEYLIENIDNFSKNIFYREVGLFLRLLIYKKTQDRQIFFMTLQEIQKNFKNEYYTLLQEVYYLEFNKNLEDNFEKRKKILEKIKV